MATGQPVRGQGLEVIARGPEELRLVRDGSFATWAHVHRAEAIGGQGGSELHIECEHSLTELLAAAPVDSRAEPLLAQARLVGTLAEQAQTTLVSGALDVDGELRDLPSTECRRLLGPVLEAAETLSTLSAELAEVLIDPSEQIADGRARDRATRAALVGIVVHENLRSLSNLLAAHPTPARPGRNEPCPCGSGRKHKHCCGQAS